MSRDHAEIGDTVTIEQFSRQSYLSYRAGPLESLAEQQLDAAGIARNQEVSIETLIVAPHLLRGTRLLTLIPERLARSVQDRLDIRLLEPPMPLDPIDEIMSWTPRHEHDPAHRRLRERLHELAREI